MMIDTYEYLYTMQFEKSTSLLIGSVEIDKVRHEEVLQKITQSLQAQQSLRIVTPYSEFIVKAEQDERFQEVLNSADLRLADGMGIIWASYYLNSKAWLIPSLLRGLVNPRSLYQYIPEKISGSDLIYDVLDIADTEKTKVFLMGSTHVVSQQFQEYIQVHYPQIEIVGAFSDRLEQGTVIMQRICESQAQLVLVALSFPQQEIWAQELDEYLSRYNQSAVIMCLGGSFDFVVGDKRRAPQWMRRVGLEWLFRLIQEPQRIKRMWVATVEFIFLMTKYKGKTGHAD